MIITEHVPSICSVYYITRNVYGKIELYEIYKLHIARYNGTTKRSQVNARWGTFVNILCKGVNTFKSRRSYNEYK